MELHASSATTMDADQPAARMFPLAQFSKNDKLKELLAAWVKDGAMAFEDTPGQWGRSTADDGGRARTVGGLRLLIAPPSHSPVQQKPWVMPAQFQLQLLKSRAARKATEWHPSAYGDRHYLGGRGCEGLRAVGGSIIASQPSA